MWWCAGLYLPFTTADGNPPQSNISKTHAPEIQCEGILPTLQLHHMRLGGTKQFQRPKIPTMQSFPSNCWGSYSFGALKNEGWENAGPFHSEMYGFSRYFFKRKIK